MHPHIQRATAADTDRLTALMHRSKASWGYETEDMALFRANWAIGIEDTADGRAFIAKRGEQILGFATGKLEENGDYTLDHLFVEPELKRQGIGSWLFEVILEDAKMARAKTIKLKSDPNAVGFYAARGFLTTRTAQSAFKNGGELHFMERSVTPQVVALEALDLKLNDKPWGFEAAHEAEIAAHWQKLVAAKPKSWNGTVLKAVNLKAENGVLSAVFSRCQYASFMAWRDWGYPDINVKNMFGCATLRAADGTVILGQMASHTSTGGQVYFPGGNLDEQDIKTDGTIDVLGSIRREMLEETGIHPDRAEAGRLFLIEDGPRVCVAQEYFVPMSAQEMRSAILAHNKALEFPELDDVIIVRSMADLAPHNIPPYAVSIVAKLLSNGSN
ncbi:GNAT family N-acetyltransferase [Pseudovibrio exalbescens]|uniref:GNAT family N-acetyltransferase n=1 Tax=Pseudovibrio exalbescens TaxID=197461 RepID=UPI002366D617|nr:GNAT family N-acetyltransferase [Pseudovibrio exalbescens]MDD7910359.1 GNAT family N-acetyltransferase [Pseudovibrio exalbescens]